MVKLAIRYVAERKKRGEIAASSAAVMRSRLLDFALSCNGQDPAKISRRHVERWLGNGRRDRAPSYTRARISTLRGFCRWCVREGHMSKDPTEGIVPPRLPKMAPRALSHDDVQAILAACPDTRSRAAALLMVQEGLRRGEVAALETGDIDWRGERLSVRGKGGRGGITRILPLSDETRRALRDYLADHPAHAGPVFRRVDCELAVTPQTVGRWVTQAMTDAGVKRAAHDGVSAHALRHTCAEDVFARGADIREVQHMLGHATMQSTQVYLRADPGQLREAMEGRKYSA